MATITLGDNDGPAKSPVLADELSKLAERVSEMTTLLRGVGATLNTIRYNGMLDNLPENPRDRLEHNRATDMIEFLTDSVNGLLRRDTDDDTAASALCDMARAAEAGRLQRTS